MSTQREKPTPTQASIASYVARNADKVKMAQMPGHAGMESVREAKYQGHSIVVRTHYEIEVDGKKLTGHVGVTNDGQVHYHPVPNLSFASAVEMVEKLIDIFPEDFGKNARGATGRPKSAGPKKTGPQERP